MVGDVQYCDGGVEDVHLRLFTLSPFVSFYPEWNQGFHVDFAIGIGSRDQVDSRRVVGGGTGVAVSIGTGYEFWLGRNTAFGLATRLDALPLGSHSAVGLALLVSFAFR